MKIKRASAVLQRLLLCFSKALFFLVVAVFEKGNRKEVVASHQRRRFVMKLSCCHRWGNKVAFSCFSSFLFWNNKKATAKKKKANNQEGEKLT